MMYMYNALMQDTVIIMCKITKKNHRINNYNPTMFFLLGKGSLGNDANIFSSLYFVYETEKR